MTLLALLGAALAGAVADAVPVLVPEGASGELLDAVARAGREEREALYLVSPRALWPDPRPRWVGEAPPVYCDDAPTRARALDLRLGEVESRIREGRAELAWVELSALRGVARCLDEVAPAETLARLYYLRGVLAFSREDTSDAADAFHMARNFQPGLGWDDALLQRLDENGYGQFSRVAEASPGPARQVRLLPAGARAWVDGRPVEGDTLQLSPGDHLIQVQGARLWTFWAHAEPGPPGVLLLPERLPSELAIWAGDPAKRADLSLILSDALGPGREVYASWADQIWRGHTGLPDWTAVEPDPGCRWRR